MQRCAALCSAVQCTSTVFSTVFSTFLISYFSFLPWCDLHLFEEVVEFLSPDLARISGRSYPTVILRDISWHTWICLTSLFHPFPSFSSFVFLIFPIFRGTLTFWSANGSHLMVCLLPTYFLFEPTKTSNIFSRPKTASTFRGPPLFWSSPCGISPPPNLAKDEGARLS